MYESSAEIGTRLDRLVEALPPAARELWDEAKGRRDADRDFWEDGDYKWIERRMMDLSPGDKAAFLTANAVAVDYYNERFKEFVERS